MKVLLVNTPLFRKGNKSFDEDSISPLGLGYIATYLKENNVEVEVIDAVQSRMSIEELISVVIEKKPAFLGLNIFSTNYLLVKELVESLGVSTHIIIGGLSTKSLYKMIISWETDNQIDIVIGDGEMITLDIVHDEVKEKPMIQESLRRIYKVDRNSKYFVKNISDLNLDRSVLPVSQLINAFNSKELCLVTSRGCIYDCHFCGAARSQNRDYESRERTVSSLVRELYRIEKDYPGIEYIRILDDLFLKSKSSILNAIAIFSRFRFNWRSMAHIRAFGNVEHEVLIELKKSGCKELFIGIESGSPAILKSINKESNINTITANATKIFQAGIDMKGYFIFGLPDEEEKDLELTYELASRLKEISLTHGVNFRTSVFQFRPYHGTKIFEQLKEKYSKIDDDYIVENKELTRLIGRKQFNFQGKNYSNASLGTIHDYICETNLISNGTRRNDHKSSSRFNQTKKM